MVTVTPYLHHRANKQGKYPLAIRITENRKSSYVFLGQTIEKNQWDKVKKKVKRSHPNSGRLNSFITKKIADINKKYIELEVEEQQTSATIIHKKILKKETARTFGEQSAVYIQNLEQEGKYNRLSAEKPRIKRFKEFLRGRDIALKDITVSRLHQYRAWLKGTRNIGERTIVNHLIVIRTIFNQAIKSGMVGQEHYPFGKGKIPIKFPQSLKIGLTAEEVKQLESLDLPQELHHVRNVWLTSFYFAGMRISDVLRLSWSDLKDGRLYYQMGKNQKVGSLKVPDKALVILEEYRSRARSTHNLIFPDIAFVEDMTKTYSVQRAIANANSKLNKRLKKIVTIMELDKKLTMHIARHTFGNLSGDKIPVQMLQKLYRHTSIVTTIGYQANFIFRDADDALDAVVDF